MENQNSNATNAQGGNLSDLKRMFNDYQKKQTQAGSGNRKTREDILSKYFVPRKTKELFRILPPKGNKKHIEEAFFHVVDIKTIGGKIKHGTIIYCPAHNDPKVKKLDANGNPIIENGVPKLVPAPCPLCAKANEILKKQNPAINGNLKKEEVERGMVLAKPGSVTPHTEFESEIYILTKEEGGRHTPFFKGYKPQFYIRTTDVTGDVTLPEGQEMVMPGDTVTLGIKLITPVALEEKGKFAIREGGHTVGAGVVTKITK